MLITLNWKRSIMILSTVCSHNLLTGHFGRNYCYLESGLSHTTFDNCEKNRPSKMTLLTLSISSGVEEQRALQLVEACLICSIACQKSLLIRSLVSVVKRYGKILREIACDNVPRKPRPSMWDQIKKITTMQYPQGRHWSWKVEGRRAVAAAEKRQTESLQNVC